MYDLVLVIYTKGNLYTFTLYSLLSRIGHLFSRPVMGGWCTKSYRSGYFFHIAVRQGTLENSNDRVLSITEIN